MRGLKRLTERGVLAQLLLQLDGILGNQWWSNVVRRVDTDDLDGETHDWLGGVEQMRERKGDPRFGELELYPFFIGNRFFQAGLTIKKGIWDHGKRGLIMARIMDQTTLAGTHPGELLQEAIQNAGARTCYDGQFFYDTDHPITVNGAAATQSNIVTQDITAPAAPTEAEMVDAILSAIERVYTLKDDKGNDVNLGYRKFLITCPVTMWQFVLKAIRAKLLPSGGTNVVADGMDFDLRTQILPKTSGNKFQLTVDQAGGAAFVFQVLDELETEVLGRESEYCKLNERLLFIARAAYAMSYGRYQHSVQVAFS